MPVSSSPYPNTRRASSSSKAINVAPSKLSASPNDERPTNSKSSGPLNATTVTVSPIMRPALLAVLISSTTSPGPEGAEPLPSLICIGFRAAVSPHEKPSVGGPCPPTGFPSLSSTCADIELTPPSAAWTPSTATTSSYTDSGKGSVAAEKSPPADRTLTSVPS